MEWISFFFSFVSFSFFSFLGDMCVCVFKNLILFKETNKRRNRSQESKPMSYGGEQFGKGRGGKRKKRGAGELQVQVQIQLSQVIAVYGMFMGCLFFFFLNSFFNSFSFPISYIYFILRYVYISQRINIIRYSLYSISMVTYCHLPKFGR